MSVNTVFKKKKDNNPERWVQSLLEVAANRGDTKAVAQRAVVLSRQLNVSPWIALAIAERLISLKEARLLDRVGRCKELQPAILDRRKTLDELRNTMPYAAHFLAEELLENRKGQGWDIRVVVRILDAILGAEKKTGDDDFSSKVRTRPLGEYEAVVDRVLGVMRRTRCDAGMALDVEAGRSTEQFAGEYVRRKRTLEIEERQMMASQGAEGSPRFPQRRGDHERRPSFHPAGGHSPAPVPHRDHWPRQIEPQFTRDHWPKI